jgi:CRP/FNR family cyclic AMP-dependent transcriptional regulator
MAIDKFKKIQYQAGEVIFQEKMAPKGLYIVESGTVEIFRWGKNRESKIRLGVVGKGEYLGELALLGDQAHSSNALAISDVTVVVLNKEIFDAQIRSNPTWLVALIKGLVAKLQKTNELVRRNGVIDETLNSAVSALEENVKREKESKQEKPEPEKKVS